jgi:y4mF family transcriptional regulator
MSRRANDGRRNRRRAWRPAGAGGIPRGPSRPGCAGAREELGLRQSELADLAGCPERFIHTVEHGKSSLRMDKVLDVLEVLGLDLLVGSGRGRVGVVPDAEPGSREAR